MRRFAHRVKVLKIQEKVCACFMVNAVRVAESAIVAAPGRIDMPGFAALADLVIATAHVAEVPRVDIDAR